MNESEEPLNAQANGEELMPFPIDPFPLPFRWSSSGLYRWNSRPIRPLPNVPQPIPLPRPGTAQDTSADASILLPLFVREELRLDVDRWYPQMIASGTRFSFLRQNVHWIANLTATGTHTWTGSIFYKDGNTAQFPYTDVSIQVNFTWFPINRQAVVTFSGGGAASLTRTYKFDSPYFHTMEFEYDCCEGTLGVTAFNTGSHPNRPAALPNENLSIETVYRRAGFDVQPPATGLVPLAGAGANAQWSDMEMHDAMQNYWSHFANAPQWSVWVFFASLHEQGVSLGGIMFDDIGPNHRQGTAIFEDAFIATPPPGDPAPAAWVTRMRFWTAVHEIGHTFNLAHSWQKALGTPWIPLSNEPEARSFMNYPYYVAGGQSAFFADFDQRFSDDELLFMRHAPYRFVQQGNADWFDHHGFQQANISPEPVFSLEVRANRDKPEFEFLEPVHLELKLKNISTQPQIVPSNLISSMENLTVVLKKAGKPAREYTPYARYCELPEMKVLQPGEALYAPLAPYAGLNGMDMIDPGYYTVQVALTMLNEEVVVSNAFRLRIAPPLGYDEEYLAQDFFDEEVGRILSMGGSKVLEAGVNTLHEVADKLAQRKVALHARIALANPLLYTYKLLVIPADARTVQPAHAIEGARIKPTRAEPDQAAKQLANVLVNKSDQAAESLGHIRYREETEKLAQFMADHGDTAKAVDIQEKLYDQLAERKVLKSVLNEVKQQTNQLSKKAVKEAG